MADEDAEDAVGTSQPSSYHTGESVSSESEDEVAQHFVQAEVQEEPVENVDNPFLED